MRGKPNTPNFKADDLALIFYKIRAARDTPTRRSLMRRARMALALRTDMTDSERHEVMCVWSKRDMSNVDSPALRKLFGHARDAHDWETVPARRHTRRSFVPPTKKPGRTRLFSDAANDATYGHSYIGPSLACQRTLFAVC